MRHVIIKLSKAKHKDLEGKMGEGYHHIQEILNNIICHFLSETLEARGQWDNIFKVLKLKENPVN